MGVCSNRTQRLSSSAGRRKWETRSGEQRRFAPPSPGGAGHPAHSRLGGGDTGAAPRQSPNLPAFISKRQRGEGGRWESSNLLAVNKALSGEDAPACSKGPENKCKGAVRFI